MTEDGNVSQHINKFIELSEELAETGIRGTFDHNAALHFVK